MLIDPECSGPCVVDLSYDGGAEMKIAEALRAIAIVAVLAWLVAEWFAAERLRKRARSL